VLLPREFFVVPRFAHSIAPSVTAFGQSIVAAAGLGLIAYGLFMLSEWVL
jgi:hypothetical protein